MLRNDRYEEIKVLISEIWEDYNLSSFPIDPFKLAEKMGFKIIKNLIIVVEKF